MSVPRVNIGPQRALLHIENQVQYFRPPLATAKLVAPCEHRGPLSKVRRNPHAMVKLPLIAWVVVFIVIDVKITPL